MPRPSTPRAPVYRLAPRPTASPGELCAQLLPQWFQMQEQLFYSPFAELARHQQEYQHALQAALTAPLPRLLEAQLQLGLQALFCFNWGMRADDAMGRLAGDWVAGFRRPLAESDTDPPVVLDFPAPRPPARHRAGR